MTTRDVMASVMGTPRGRPTRRARGWATPARRMLGPEPALVWLVVLTVVAGTMVARWQSFPPSLLAVPLVIAGFLLGPREAPWFVVFVLLVVALTVPFQAVGIRFAVQVAVLYLLGLIVLLGSFRRSRLGVAGSRGESMFVDLRDRIMRQSGVPDLPPGWYAESALRSAGRTPFAGDFMLVGPSEGSTRLDVALVDVSGQGAGAGTRALLLSGAFGGLLGALPPEEFLPAANQYVHRLEWEEGFATAIHLALDLATGEFQIRSAGHPPAVHFQAGSGRWTVLEAAGPVLGLLAAVEYPAVRGTMRRGDALLLYTDGLVESRDRDLSLGIDKLVGHAERLLRYGFEGGADRLVDALGSPHDDRTLLLIHRR